MNEEGIQEILDRLGSRVGHLSEENRLCKLRDDACKELISQLADIIAPSDWVKLYESTENTFVKDLMTEWGAHLFPNDYKY
tara:strand:- start:20 stop:262 length:243 start_codon:yes stop_codon:yes gene_type:complete